MSNHHKRNKHLQKFSSIHLFLAEYRLCQNSTPEIRAYVDFCMTRRRENGCLSCDRLPGFEKHHIVPREVCGRNTPKNYVNMTKADHLYAHWLFAKAILSHKNLKVAMSSTGVAKCAKIQLKTIVKVMLESPKIVLLPYHCT